jgi:hypothetical protein
MKLYPIILLVCLDAVLYLEKRSFVQTSAVSL